MAHIIFQCIRNIFIQNDAKELFLLLFRTYKTDVISIILK